MAGTALSKFADFVAATGPAYLTGPDVLVNEAVERNYLWGALASGPQGVNIQTGAEIKDSLMLDASNTFEFYKPNATFSYRNPNVLDTTSAPWRFAVDHMAFTDHEIELNAGDGLSVDGIKNAWRSLSSPTALRTRLRSLMPLAASPSLCLRLSMRSSLTQQTPSLVKPVVVVFRRDGLTFRESTHSLNRVGQTKFRSTLLQQVLQSPDRNKHRRRVRWNQKPPGWWLPSGVR